MFSAYENLGVTRLEIIFPFCGSIRPNFAIKQEILR